MLPTCGFYTMLHHVSRNFLPSPKISAFRGISGFSPEIRIFSKKSGYVTYLYSMHQNFKCSFIKAL